MQTPLDEYILDILKKKMKEKDITPTELSLSINRNAAFISQIFSGSSRLKLNMYHLNFIAQALDCPMSDFFPNPYIDYDETLYNKHLKNK